MSNYMSEEKSKQFLTECLEVFGVGMKSQPPERRAQLGALLAAGAQLQLTVIMLPVVRIVCRIGAEQAFAFDVELTLPIDPMKFN